MLFESAEGQFDHPHRAFDAARRDPSEMMRRVFPAIGLFFLAPLVAEFLLGNLPITALPFLVVLAPLYGGGALLIREVARRSGRGWPTMVTLGLAYAVLEEGITTMSLFNPNYAGVHLLDNGFIPALGIAGPWTVVVLTLHTVWSISVPIALVEEMAEPGRTTPWLGRLGLGITGIVFLFGIVVNTAFSVVTYHFVATPFQLLGAGAVVVILIVAGMLLGWSPRVGTASSGRRAPNPWLVGVASFVATGIFKALPVGSGLFWVIHGIVPSLPTVWSPWLLVVLVLGLGIGAVIVVYSWSRRNGWGGEQRLALAGGALLTYALTAFPQTPVLPASPTVDLIGNVVFALGAIVFLVLAARRARVASPEPEIAHRFHSLGTRGSGQ